MGRQTPPTRKTPEQYDLQNIFLHSDSFQLKVTNYFPRKILIQSFKDCVEDHILSQPKDGVYTFIFCSANYYLISQLQFSREVLGLKLFLRKGQKASKCVSQTNCRPLSRIHRVSPVIMPFKQQISTKLKHQEATFNYQKNKMLCQTEHRLTLLRT